MQSKKLQNLKKSFFGYIKRIFFDQNSPVHLVSESKGVLLTDQNSCVVYWLHMDLSEAQYESSQNLCMDLSEAACAFVRYVV